MRLSLIFCFLLLVFESKAKCGPGTITLYPSKGIIERGAWLQLEFSGVYLQLADSIEQSLIKPVLKDQGGNHYPIKLVKRLNGEFSCAQMMFETPDSLRLGTPYVLVYEGISKTGRLKEWLGRMEPQFIQVLEPKPVKMMDFQVKWLRNEYVPLGCGPSVHACFSIDVPEHGNYWLRCRLSAEGDVDQEIILEADSLFSLGHDMCQGMIQFLEGESYSASFELLSADGELIGHPNACSFAAPSPKIQRIHPLYHD